MDSAGKISSNYRDLVSLTTRQAMAAMDITVEESSLEVKTFLKDIGGSGCVSPLKFRYACRLTLFIYINVGRRVNAIERLYEAMPAYLYLNASILGSMLVPLLESQDQLTIQSYALLDVGKRILLACILLHWFDLCQGFFGLMHPSTRGSMSSPNMA